MNRIVHPREERRPLRRGVAPAIAVGVLAGGQFLAVSVPLYFMLAGISMTVLALVAISEARSFSPARALGLAALCVAPLLVSVAINEGDFGQAAPPLALTLFAIAAYAIGSSLEEEDWRILFPVTAVVGAFCFVAAAVAYRWDVLSAFRGGQRLLTGMHPNLFGLTAMTVFLVALPSRSTALRWMAFGLAAAACMASSSRSAILAMLVVALLAWTLRLQTRPLKLIWIGYAVALGAVLTFAFAAPILGELGEAVFHINDPHRGLASGGSGRLRLWQYFFDQWQREPVFGPGPGTAFEMGGRAIYSHNLVLQILTDSGLVGLIGFLIFIALLLVALLSSKISSTLRMAGLLALSTYLIYGIFEGRAVNIGNPLSAVFFFIAFASLGASDPIRALARGRRHEVQAEWHEAISG